MDKKIDFMKSQYEHYLSMFQNRYVMASICTCSKCITWQLIHFWRVNMNCFGGRLISEGHLDFEQHIKNKNTIIREHQGKVLDIPTLQQAIKLRPNDKD